MTVFFELVQVNAFNDYRKQSNGPYLETHNQGGGTTLISLGSKANQRIKEELHINLIINTLQDSLQHIKIMVAQLSQRQHLLTKPLHLHHSQLWMTHCLP